MSWVVSWRNYNIFAYIHFYEHLWAIAFRSRNKINKECKNQDRKQGGKDQESKSRCIVKLASNNLYGKVFHKRYVGSWQGSPLRQKCPYLKFFWSMFSQIWTKLCKSSYSVRMWENADHKNFEYEHFLHNAH